ncbi:hypothetical protein [Litchfieldia salsa]|uniref:Uncharacterized protein n=1 Tax=Litchfieldia salsa TaxID=930152 RepID=A0A1H0UD59_9BACI|nr:hypothetical protein [Litchfieldia salsa]SDP64071.1 hypothetical protein SAMN05216565_104314 [Litchfieldia salsa]
MLESNKKITYTSEELIKVLKHLNIMVVSFDKIGSYYGSKMNGNNDEEILKECDCETIRFMNDWKIPQRLSEIRAILSDKFDRTLGDDDMDDLERAMEGLKYWSKPNDKP